MRALVLLSALVLSIAPIAFAGEKGPAPDDHVHLLAEGDVNGEHYYVVEDHGAILVFRETNGILFGGVEGSGVQPAWTCVDGDALTYIWPEEECARGVKVAPDERVTNSGLVHAIVELLPEEVHHVVDELLP